MKTWDLTAATAKLELALKTLQAANADVAELWSDDNHRRFEETFLSPLTPKTRTLLDAIQHLAEVLDRAERQCGTE